MLRNIINIRFDNKNKRFKFTAQINASNESKLNQVMAEYPISSIILPFTLVSFKTIYTKY